MSAGATLTAAAKAALGAVEGLNGAYDGPPLTASLPWALVEAGPESDWGWKGGIGRELRLAVSLRDAGERPERLRGLIEAVEVTVGGINGVIADWRVVSCVFLRSRMAKVGAEWVGLVEYRVRMMRE